MDLSKLSIEQLEVAERVIAEAKRQGVNPNFVLPLVMQESGFKQESTSKKGALGVMQLMPATAKGLGVDPSDLDENIRGGITYFKQQLENPAFAGDPNSAYIAYNAGPNAKFFKTGDPADIPLETLEYLEKIRNFSGGQLSGPARVQPSVAVPKLPPPAEVKSDEESGAGGTTEGTSKELNPMIGAGFGAAAGTTAGAAVATSQAKLDAARKAYDVFTNRGAAPVAEAPPAPPAARPAQAAAPTPKHGGQNWVKALTDVDLPEAQMSKADLDTAKGMKVAVGRAGEPGFTGGTITKGGVIINPQTAAAMQPTPAQVAAENARLMREAKQKVATERVMSEMLANKNAPPAAQAKPPANWLAYAKRLGAMPVMGGLAGASAGFGAVDALNRYNKKDKTGAAIGGLGTAAGLAAGFVPSMGALPAAGLAAPLYLTASDRIEYLKKHPEMIKLMEDEYDAMGNRQR
jgi:hypothetical protein